MQALLVLFDGGDGRPLVIMDGAEITYWRTATDSALGARILARATPETLHHPFFGGNKRLGFVVGILFLEINGYEFRASEEQAANAVIDLAAGKLDEAGYRQFLDRKLWRAKQRKR